MPTVSILIPSRLEKSAGGELFIAGAIASIEAQTVAGRVGLEIVVGVDRGARIPAELSANALCKFAEGRSQSQASALNAAANLMTGDHVAILEDDDRWEPSFLEHAVSALHSTNFVSSTQLEVGPDGNVIRINDFATPSGWVMKRRTWDSVGPFNERFRWHLDSDWLGRLNQTGALRTHLVEATAPVTLETAAQVRPWLANCIRFGGPALRLVHHDSPWPLIRRLVHASSGMHRIATNRTFTLESQNEKSALVQRYGAIPW